MEFVNALYLAEELRTDAERAAMAEAIHILTLVLSPFAPHTGVSHLRGRA